MKYESTFYTYFKFLKKIKNDWLTIVLHILSEHLEKRFAGLHNAYSQLTIKQTYFHHDFLAKISSI